MAATRGRTRIRRTVIILLTTTAAIGLEVREQVNSAPCSTAPEKTTSTHHAESRELLLATAAVLPSDRLKLGLNIICQLANQAVRLSSRSSSNRYLARHRAGRTFRRLILARTPVQMARIV